jgi:hypothetical protein
MVERTIGHSLKEVLVVVLILIEMVSSGTPKRTGVNSEPRSWDCSFHLDNGT